MSQNTSSPAHDTPLGFLLVEVARLYRARMDKAFEAAGLGLTAGEARTLAYVDRHPGLRQRALAVKMNVEPMTLVGFLDRLEAQELVIRRADPTDRRAKTVHLTPKAPPLVARILDAGKQMRLEILAGIGPQEQAVFFDCLGQMSANLSTCGREQES